MEDITDKLYETTEPNFRTTSSTGTSPRNCFFDNLRGGKKPSLDDYDNKPVKDNESNLTPYQGDFEWHEFY